MNKLYNILIAFSCLFILTADNKALAQCTASNSLVTAYNNNNGQSGIMFDIYATNCVTVRCFESNIDAVTDTYRIYYKTGTHVGFETNSAAWTLLGSASVTGNGPGVPTYIPIIANVTINAGQRAAFYITSTTGSSMNYTDGTAVGNLLASDANLRIYEGTGKAWSFSTNYVPRRFNGRVYYNATAPPTAPGPISGTSPVCQGTSQTYSVSPVTGATSYNWTVPAGWTITSGQGTTSITATVGASAGNICVTASNSCGTSTASCRSISVTTAPAAPGAISGSTSVCNSTSQTYSITAVSGATSYNWTVPTGWTITSGQGTTSISVTTGTTGGNVCVTASNSCGTSSASCTAVTVNSAPSQPGTITGNTSVCNGAIHTYSISSVTGATSYTWTVPTGTTINSGQGTTSISVTFGSTGGNICVTANNSCGSSTARCNSITVTSVPATPGSITGALTVCPSTTETYSISAVSGATSYNWTVPTGWTITSGQGTTSISVTTGSSGGNVCVVATNTCGSSSQSCRSVTIGAGPSAPGAISGDLTVCENTSEIYSITAVSGASSYNWTVPAGWTINSGQGTTSISVTTGANTGNICVNASNSCGTSSNSCQSITVLPPPASTTSVIGSTSLCEGSTATYSTQTSTGATNYNWTVPTGATINSGQGTTSISVTFGSSSGNICVSAENTCGSSSPICELINISSTSVGGSVLSNDTVCQGSNSGTLTLSGYNGGILKWQSSTNNGVNWLDFANTTSSFSFSNLTDTTIYRAIVQSGVCSSDTSASAEIVVLPAVNGGTLSSNATYCSSINRDTLKVTGHTSTINSWEFSTDNGATWNSIANTDDTLIYNNITQTTLYRVVLDGIGGGTCPGNVSSIATVTINPPTDGGVVTNDTTVCSGTNSGILYLTGYTGTVQNWEVSTDSSSWFILSNNVDTFAYNNLTTTTWYRVSVKSLNCAAEYSVPAKVTVDEKSLGGIVNTSENVCFGSNGNTLTLTASNGNVLNWLESNGGVTWNNITNTSNTHSYSNLMTTTYYSAIVKNGVCPADTATAAIITVDPVVAGGSISQDDTFCMGNNNGTLILSGHSGTVQQWELSNDGGFTWINLSNTSNTQSYNNLSITTLYRAVVNSGQCGTAYSDTAEITIIPQSNGGVINGGSVTVCADTSNGTLKLTSYVGSILSWEASTNGGSTWNAIANTTDSLNYTNLTTTTIYRAIVQNSFCDPDTSTTATITVNPETVGGTVVINDTVCSGNNNGTLTLTGHVGNVLNWEVSTDGGSTWNVLSNNSDTLNYNNVTITSMYRARLKSGNACSDAYSTVATITVISPSNGGSVLSSNVVCADSNGDTLLLDSYNGNVIFWQSSVDNGTSWNNILNTSDSLIYSNLLNTTWYRAYVQNGVCPAVSSTIAVITVNDSTDAGILSSSTTVCSGLNNNTLELTGYTGAISGWESSTDGGNTWQSISNTTPTQVYNNLTSSIQYRVRVKSGVCEQKISDIAYIEVDQQSNAGTLNSSVVACETENGDTLELVNYNGNIINWLYSGDSGNSWDQVYSGIAPGDSTLPDTLSYSNLSSTLWYMVIVQNGVCPPDTSNMAIIHINKTGDLIANDDETWIKGGQNTTINVMDNDSGNWDVITLILSASQGLASNNNDGTISYIPNQSYLGLDSIQYEICNNCGICDTATVRLEVGLFVPTGFSPDGDNINDFFVISGINNYPENSINIFNRWGNLVYSAAPYKNEWDGKSNNSSLKISGDNLVDGTYFYTIQLGPNDKPVNGYVELRRGN